MSGDTMWRRAHCSNCGANTEDDDIYAVSRGYYVHGLGRFGQPVLGLEENIDTNKPVVFCGTCSTVTTLIEDDVEEGEP